MSDLIDRQAAIDALDQIFDRCEEIEAHLPEGDPDRTGYKMYPDYMTVWKYLHQLPTIEQERKKGRWIYSEDDYGIDGYHCDKCGFFVPWDYAHKFINYIDDYNYCPNCGTCMKGEQP